MGQYYIAVNLDKKQFIKPHDLDDGAKLMEWNNAAQALVILMSAGNGRGGGDCRSNHPIIGSWAGDRVVVAGDYSDDGAFGAPEKVTIYEHARETYQNVSAQILAALKEDGAR